MSDERGLGFLNFTVSPAPLSERVEQAKFSMKESFPRTGLLSFEGNDNNEYKKVR